MVGDAIYSDGERNLCGSAYSNLLVELGRLELPTSSVRGRRSPN